MTNILDNLLCKKPQKLIECIILCFMLMLLCQIAIEKLKVVEKEVEIKIKKAIGEAEKSANKSKILKKQQEIENQMYMAREKSLADTDFYR